MHWPWSKSPDGRKPPEIPTTRSISPEQGAGFFSNLWFAWLNPLMTTGQQRHLERTDIWIVPDKRRIKAVEASLHEAFRVRVIAGSRLPILFALYETFKFGFWCSAFCQFLVSTLQVMVPFTLRFLIQWVQNAYFADPSQRNTTGIGTGIGYLLGIIIMQLLQVFASSQFYYRSTLMGGQCRSALISMAFTKALKLSNRAKAGGDLDPLSSGTFGEVPWRADPKGWSNGRIMNLISTDTARIEQAVASFHLSWLSVYQLALTIALLVYNLGWTALTGVATILVGLVGVTYAAKPLVTSRAAINKVTDKRVTLTQEVLQGIRFIKYFSWETFFLKKLKGIRSDETRAVRLMHLLRCGVGTLAQFLPVLGIMITFIVYAIVYGKLDPAAVFSSLAIFYLLRTPTNWLPISIMLAADAMESLRRIECFLLSEELAHSSDTVPDTTHVIRLENAAFTWESNLPSSQEDNNKKPTSETVKSESKGKKHQTEKDSQAQMTASDGPAFSLNNISFEFKKNELVGIVGMVGSGKTSLLGALAGDMRQTAGAMMFSGSRAYCPQSPWIQNATVKDNIIFGKAFDRQRYADVVHACALEPDLEILPQGDATDIGERGVTLSGGQKQRINIARAMYSDADILLLDDPLSAVDAHVGSHIFNEAICKLLQSKCRLLATHHLHLLSRFDKIIWMVNGQISAHGTFPELMESNQEFRNLVQTSLQHQSSGDDADSQQQDDKGNSSTSPDQKQETANSKSADTEALMQEEMKAVDSVPLSVYVAWLRASGSLWNGALLLISQSIFRASSIFGALWLTWWVDDRFHLTRSQNIGIYIGLSFSQCILVFLSSLLSCLVCIRASQVMSNEALWHTLRAPISLFDTTPLGRIVYRFTRDIDALDNNLVVAVQQLLINGFGLAGSYALIVAYFYYFAIALTISVFIVCWCIRYYRSSAREIRRHQLVFDGAVFARFNEALLGASTIRAYGRQFDFTERVQAAIDDMDSATFLTFASQNWLTVRLDNISIFLGFVTGLLVVTNVLSVSPSVSGLLMTYSISMVGIMQIVVKYLIEVNNAMSNTERLFNFTNSLEQEASLEGDNIRSSWPETGCIQYESIKMRYRPELPLVVDGFTLEIRGGEKIGIVGRTGAGKSTILSTLFRLTEICGGTIKIDGVDIGKIGLHRLRSSLAIIPQDPTLFQGTVRSNLDPFDQHTDQELWDALRGARVVPSGDSKPLGEGSPAAETENAEVVAEKKSEAEKNRGTEKKGEGQNTRVTLDAHVEAEGLNFSVGQRQLLALSRALLRNTKIVLVDEGTSSVDPQTDTHIQKTLATGLIGKTLIAIAHRLSTVVQYDRVCVMDKGTIVELDSPINLWEQGGLFRAMCDSNGITRELFNKE